MGDTILPVKTSELPQAATITENDVIVIVQNGKTYQMRYSVLQSALNVNPILGFNPLTGVLSIGSQTLNIYDPYSVTVSGSATFVIGAGRIIDFVEIQPAGDDDYKIGTSEDGEEIDSGSYTDGDPFPVVELVQKFAAQTTIYLTATDATFKIYLR